jgi:long-chain acyl-CoA synthetase
MADTIVHRFFETAKKRGDAPGYLVKSGGIWHATSWREYGEEVDRAARALIDLGLEFGDRVCILGFNRPEWVIFDLAAMAAGGAPAGIYTSCSPEEVKYIVAHSEAPIVLVEDEEQWEKIAEVRAELPNLKKVVLMKGERVEDELCLSWDDFMARGGAEGSPLAEQRRERTDRLEPNQLATLIYTSGTTGPAKGVMLSHQNLAWTSRIATQVAALDSASRSLSYLPLSHIAEQVFTIHGPVTAGSTVYFAESIDKVADNLKDCRPTTFFGVPRIWEKFYAAIHARLEEATGARAKLVGWARDVGLRANQLKCRGEEPSGLLAAQYALARRLVFSKLHAAVGLDQATTLVSGAAPISREILEFFMSLDLIVQEVYGQSEDTGPTSFNLVGRTKIGSVGPPFPGVEVKIADDGEILVKGPNVFLGYFKDEEATDRKSVV